MPDGTDCAAPAGAERRCKDFHRRSASCGRAARLRGQDDAVRGSHADDKRAPALSPESHGASHRLTRYLQATFLRGPPSRVAMPGQYLSASMNLSAMRRALPMAGI